MSRGLDTKPYPKGLKTKADERAWFGCGHAECCPNGTTQYGRIIAPTNSNLFPDVRLVSVGTQMPRFPGSDHLREISF